ncbi:hypothetical protein M1N64_00900 [Peptococcaceae bacterium]|nr:hypothetical protein [Peptococcaceae bacterium]
MKTLLEFLTNELPRFNNISFHEEVEDDLFELAITVDEVCLSEIIDGLRKLNSNPNLGRNLENKYGMNLTEFSKFYVCAAKIRIVYIKKHTEGKLIAEIWAIAPRKDFDAYIRTNSRYLTKKR